MSYDPRWQLLDRIWKSDTSVRVYDTSLGDPASSADIVVDNSTVATFAADGLTLAAGVAVSEFSIDGTLAGDSTSTVATEYAVKTYVDAQIGSLTQDRIIDGNSSVQVIDDSGDATSTVNFTLDGALNMSLTEEGLKFDAAIDLSVANARVRAFSSDASLGGYDGTAPGGFASDDLVPTQLAVRTYIDDIHAAIEDPTGFFDQSSSVFGVDQTGSTATFYIQPASGSYQIWMLGQRWVKQVRDEVEISDVEGLHYIYFDGSGVLQETTTFSTALLYQYATVAFLYWNATDKEVQYLGEERHGISMSGKTHANLHLSTGTLYVEGLALGNLTVDSTGDADVDAQFSVGAGRILDEDISIAISEHTFPASFPMWYLDGATMWRKHVATDFPLINDGTSRVSYNLDTGGNWSLVEADEGYYVLTHVFATNGQDNDIVGIVGQQQYATVAAARLGASDEINQFITGSMPFAEFVPIATVIFQTSNTYSNTPKARLVTNDENESWTDWRTSGLTPVAGSSTDHGSLSGLANDDHLQYAHLAGWRSFYGNQGFQAGITISGGGASVVGGVSVTSSNVTLTGGGYFQVNGSASINEFSIDGTLDGNSDTALPTEKAVKTYVDTEIQDLRNELDLINIVEVFTDATAVTGDVVLVDTTAGNVTITLQEHPDGKVMIKKITSDSNSVIVQGAGGLIDNLSARSFSTPNEAYTYICDGTNFYVF